VTTTPRTPARKKIPPAQTRGDAPKAPARPRAAKKAAPKPPAKAVAKKATTAKRAAVKKAAPAKRAPRSRTPKPPVDTKPNVREPGAVELKVRADIEALVSGHPMGEALAAMSYALARGIDEGPEMMRAALNRELRLNLAELAGMSVGGDDLGAELSIPEGGETG
jgi:hypothetical protein